MSAILELWTEIFALTWPLWAVLFGVGMIFLFLVMPAYATVQVPESYIDNLIPENMTANVNDPAKPINDWSNAIIEPLTDKLGVWVFPMVTFGVFIGLYAAKENFIYASIPAMILVMGNLALFPNEIGVFVTLVFIAGYSGALWYGLKSGRG